MKTLNELDHSQIYILGVSGGPDSMALFNMCLQAKLSIVAAHMNYQIRDSAYRDMKIVEDYACANQVPCQIRLQTRPCSGNFEAFAREQRYAFYAELVERYHAAGVLLAHHMDDHIETYLMQKERGSEGTVYGIASETIIKGCKIFRPLLAYTKEDIMVYCQQHKVPYGIDETNLSLDYTRNRIRHTMMADLTLTDKHLLCQHIEDENIRKEQKRQQWQHYMLTWDHSMKELVKLSTSDLNEFLFYYLHEVHQMHVPNKEINTLQNLLLKNEDGWSRTIANRFEIYQEYGKLCVDSLEDISYAYEFTSIAFVQMPYFRIAETGSTLESATLTLDDFPITIRNARNGDSIQLRFGRKKLNRWFIDRKIPKKERKRWPVVQNKLGNIVLVPKIGCDIAHFSNNPNLFVLK